MTPTRILVLSGGGSKGAFQLGVLRTLLDDRKYDAIFGVSTGALTGAILAQGGTLASQRSRLLEVELIYLGLRGIQDVLRGGTTLLSKAWNLWRHGGIYNTDPLRALIAAHVDPTTLQNSSTYFSCGYTDLELGVNLSATPAPDIRDFVLASATQPVFFQMRSVYADGGVCHMTPLGDAFRWIKTRPPAPVDIHIIVCNPLVLTPTPELKVTSATQVLGRTFTIIEQQIFLNDINVAAHKNHFPASGDRCANLVLYAPKSDLGDGLDFSPAHIRRMYLAGAEIAPHLWGWP